MLSPDNHTNPAPTSAPTTEPHLNFRGKLLSHVHVMTGGMARELEIERKREWCREFQARNLDRTSVIKNFPTVYMAAGRDIAFPVALGATNVRMIDPRYDLFPSERTDIVEKFATALDIEATWIDHTTFRFVNPTSNELVQIKLDGGKGPTRFDIPDHFGMLMFYNPAGNLTEELLRRVVVGGYVLGNCRWGFTDPSSSFEDISLTCEEARPTDTRKQYLHEDYIFAKKVKI